MSSRTYAEKLKDPRWQKKRLDILNRDGFTCQGCKDSEVTLHIHHTYYEKHKEPWEYEDDSLITYCKYCHFIVAYCEANFKPYRFSWVYKTSRIGDTDLFFIVKIESDVFLRTPMYIFFGVADDEPVYQFFIRGNHLQVMNMMNKKLELQCQESEPLNQSF